MFAFVMPRISINIVLSRMEQTTDADARPQTFTIEFIKEDGSLRKMKAQKHVKVGTDGSVDEKSRFKYNLKSKNSILLYDVDAQEYRTVKVASIIRFNNAEVLH
jgi:hypothetical protein